MRDLQSAVLDPWLGAILLLVLGCGWIGLGIYWGRRAKNLEGFMLAGRNVGLALAAATAMATWVTSNTIMLAPLFGLKYGIWGMLAYSTASFGLFLFAPMAHRIRALMPSGFTSGDFMRLRYGKAAWTIFLFITLVYSMAWLVSMGMAGGKFLEALSGIPYQYGMSAILFVCVVYTLFGGLYAVIGTDFIQSIIILLGIVIVGAVVLTRIEVDTVYETMALQQPMLLKVLMPVSLLVLFNNLFFGLGEVFHNNVWWSRAFSMRKGVPFKAFLLAGALWLPIPVAAGFIGMCAGPLGINTPDPDMVGPLVASKVLGAGGAILIFIVLFCSLASSIDSLLAATADLVTEDIYRKWINPDGDEATARKMSTWIIVGLGAVTWALCVPNFGNLIEVLFRSGPLVASAIWPVVAGLFFKKPSHLAAVVAMLGGSIAGSVVYESDAWYLSCVVSTAVSLISLVVVTAIKPAHFNWKQLDESPGGTS
jgi:Na+/proline symporter